MLKDLQKALMTGVSYMLPFLVIAGMTIAITGMVSEYIHPTLPAVNVLRECGWILMDFIPAVFAAYVAYDLGRKIAIAPGFIGGFLAGNPIIEGTAASGFLGAIITGLLAGYLVAFLKKIKVHPLLESIKESLFIPVFVSLVIIFISSFLLAYSVGILNEFVIDKIVKLSKIPEYALIVGAVLSIMCAVDMGGPLNKLALLSVFALWSDPSGIGFVLNAALFPGLMIPGISTGITALIAKNKFTISEQENAPTAIISGLFGIAEIALPYAFRDPLRTIVPNVIGAAIGGAIMMRFNVYTAGVSGVFGIPMASNIPIFLVSIISGIVISILIQLIWRKPLEESGVNINKKQLSI